MSDSKYSSSVPRKRRAHESNTIRSENDVDSTMAQTSHGDIHHRLYDIAAPSEWNTRHSYNVNNWLIRWRKQFTRYVRCSIHFQYLYKFSFYTKKQLLSAEITRVLIF